MALTAERLRELVHYDPLTGAITRRVALSNRSKVGDLVGSESQSDGYLYARVGGSSYAVHRLVWLYMTGHWPQHQINHRNDIRTDNRFENLLDRPKAIHLAERFAAAPKAYGLPANGADAAFILRTIMDYDAETGVLRWKVGASKYSNIKPGDVFGARKPRGYCGGSILGRDYLSHRLAWLHVHGDWPRFVIDHIDGDPSNNRIENLRDVPMRVNRQNQRVASGGSITGVLGVHVNPGSTALPYRSKIGVDGARIHLGDFETIEQAHAAYINAKRLLHPGNTL